MKTKDIIQLVVAVIILVVSGALIYQQIGPKTKSQGAADAGQTIEIVTPLSPDFDQVALQKITDTQQVRDFYSPPDLNSGLGNSQPFGPLR